MTTTSLFDYNRDASPDIREVSTRQKDGVIVRKRALAFCEAAGEPKQIEWYDAGHSLN
jgi:hypothetical protein